MAKAESLHLRLSSEERAAIERRATEAGMSLTAYVVGAALGRLPAEADDVQRRLAELERRVDELEQRS